VCIYVCDYKSRNMYACRNMLLSQCVCVRACRNHVAAKRRGGACLSRPMCHPYYKNRPMHTKNKGQTRTRKSGLCSITLLAGLTKSARMHKHANETRVDAGLSHAYSRLYSPTHAAASEHAFPALRHAFPTPQRRRRQQTRLENTNTQDKEDKARAQCEAHFVVCNASNMPANPHPIPQCQPTARAPAVSM